MSNYKHENIDKQIILKMKKQICLLTLFLLLVSMVQAQKGILKGKIVDESNLALPGAYIYSSDKNYAAVTDVHGNYVITNIPEGEYDIKVTYIGFNDTDAHITIAAGKTTVKDFSLKAGIGLDEVQVSASLQGQSKALNQQKTSARITNVISSDQVGKFPDANIGDALKRIPGINVEYDQGEARFGTVRGIAPQYNSVTINGERIPSAEAETRSVQLDLIPSDMIQMVEVSKAVTPDMDGDAIGGSINLVTLSQPYKQRFTASVGSGYNFISETPAVTANLIYGNRYANNIIGIELSASYDDNSLGSDDIEAEWDGDNDNFYLDELQIRQYFVQRIRQSYSANFDFKINDNNTIYLKGMYNRRKDFENRYRNVFKTKGEPTEKDSEGYDIYTLKKVNKQIKVGDNNKNARLEDQQMMQFSLNGDHILGKVKADWGVSFSKASEDRPDERYLQYVQKGDDDTYVKGDISDPRKPFLTLSDESLMDFSSGSGWDFDELTNEHQNTYDEDLVARLNFEIPLAQGVFKNSLKFGGKYKAKSKKRDNNFYTYTPNDEESFNSQVFANTKDQSRDNYIPGDKYDVGKFVTKEFAGGLDVNSSDFTGEPDYSEYAGNFDATEDVTAGYIMLNQQLGTKLSAVAGVRIENTSTEGEGYDYDDDAKTLTSTGKLSHNYTNILPDLHLKYNLNNNSILRFAYTTTMSRPGYFDLIPYLEIEDDGETVSIGNSELIPTTSNNIDLMFEHYIKSIGMISGGFFYKNINDFIVDYNDDDYTYNGVEGVDFSQPMNAGDADLLGFEISVQRQLNFLPGLGIYANYSYTHSKINNFQIKNDDGDIRTDVEVMAGTPENTFNASISYDKKGFGARISYNYAGAFIDEYGNSSFNDIYYDKATHVDFNLNYSFKKHYLVYVNLNNLTNQPLRYYQGQSDRTYQAEYYNMTAKFGIKANF